MKRFAMYTASILTLILMVGSFMGCRSTPKIDWNSRVGNYTYDEAVVEFGPPDRSAELSDSSTVAEWFYGRRSSFSLGLGTGVYTGPVGVGVGVPVPVGGGRAKVLRLVFGPDGILKSWVQR